jgi:hypothetical protein
MEVSPLWSEFGLAGMVIGALFFGAYFIIKWILSFVNSLAEQHAKERNEWQSFSSMQLEQHRNERNEWRDEIVLINKTQSDNIDKVCEAISKNITSIALRDVSKKE